MIHQSLYQMFRGATLLGALASNSFFYKTLTPEYTLLFLLKASLRT